MKRRRPVEAAILQRFTQVGSCQVLITGQVGNRTCDFYHAMISTRTQTKACHGLIQELAAGVIEYAYLFDLLISERVICAATSCQLA